jgi:hypothetical protein
MSFRPGQTMTREKKMRRDFDARVRDGEGQLFIEELGEALADDKDLRHRISIRRLLEEFVPGGREIVDSWDPQFGGSGALRVDNLLEDGDAVSSSAFAHITGQIVYTEVMKSFDDETFVFSDIVPNVPTKFNGEVIPGIGRMGNVAEAIGEGKPYPRAGLNEDWIRTPTTQKRGLMIDLTREAVFFDRTNMLLERAQELGRWLGYNKELRLIDAFIDENVTTHRYNWKDTAYASYQTSSPWDNTTASAALVDWTDIDEAEQTLAAILDPNTGTPILNTPKDLVVCRENLYKGRRIVSATEITVVTAGYATSGNPTETKARNPIANYRIVSSQLLAARMTTDTTWYLGDIARMIRYMENFPLQVEQAPVGSGDMWERDIAMSWKAGERGAAVVVEPRVTTKCTA